MSTNQLGVQVDGNDDVNPDAADGFYRDADSRVRDAINISARNIDLDANGGSIGVVGDDLDIDSGAAALGRLFAEASANVYITEVNGALNVLAVVAENGSVRLTVPDTSAADTENLVLLAGGTARVAENGVRLVSISDISAALMVVEIGMVTPPLGMNVYVIAGMARDIPMSEAFRGIVPFLISDIVRVVILVLFPSITLCLVRWLT